MHINENRIHTGRLETFNVKKWYGCTARAHEQRQEIWLVVINLM